MHASEGRTINSRALLQAGLQRREGRSGGARAKEKKKGGEVRLDTNILASISISAVRHVLPAV